MLAIARQLVNFLTWQQQQQSAAAVATTTSDANPSIIPLEIVDCPDSATQDALWKRMQTLWDSAHSETTPKPPFPSHITFSNQPLESYGIHSSASNRGNETTTNNLHGSSPVYLSPDAPQTLDSGIPPPHTLVVGLLIDRRVQVNRSRQRADQMTMASAQLPLYEAGIVFEDATTNHSKTTTSTETLTRFSSSEPLNVDCVLEAVQQWNWNCESSTIVRDERRSVEEQIRAQQDCCFDALLQALLHHSQRHPGRTQHATSSSSKK